jgi:mutator protein MutT
MQVDNAGYYHLPGGHVEIGETSERAIIREVKEETGINVKIKKLVCVNEYFYEKTGIKHNEVVFYFVVTPTEKIETKNEIRIESDHNKIKNNELRWATLNEIKSLEIKPQMIKDLIVADKLNEFCHIITH